MGRPALAAGRAIEILTFLAARPTESFTLTEIAEQLDLSLASCHALMKVLSDAGYVSRHPVHKSYELGPALVAVGHAALERHRAIDLARDEVRRLADTVGLEAIASVPIGDDLVVLARAGRSRELDLLPRIGQRVPLAPPIGGVFVAWAPAARVDEWLDRSVAAKRDRVALGAVLGVIRDHGYEVALESPSRDRIADVLTELAMHPHSDAARTQLPKLVASLLREEHHPAVIDDDARYDVNYCMAPVFDARGNVVLGITLLGFAPLLAGSELRASADALVRGARAITVATEGRLPVTETRR